MGSLRKIPQTITGAPEGKFVELWRMAIYSFKASLNIELTELVTKKKKGNTIYLFLHTRMKNLWDTNVFRDLFIKGNFEFQELKLELHKGIHHQGLGNSEIHPQSWSLEKWKRHTTKSDEIKPINGLILKAGLTTWTKKFITRNHQWRSFSSFSYDQAAHANPIVTYLS